MMKLKRFFAIMVICLMTVSFVGGVMPVQAEEIADEEMVVFATSTDSFVWRSNTSSVTLRLSQSVTRNSYDKKKYTAVMQGNSTSTTYYTFYLTNSNGESYPLSFTCDGTMHTEPFESSIPAGTYTVTVANISGSGRIEQLTVNFMYN